MLPLESSLVHLAFLLVVSFGVSSVLAVGGSRRPDSVSNVPTFTQINM